MSESIQKILKKAIHGEDKSSAFYAKLANKIKHFNVKVLFEKLSLEELKHKEFLQDTLARTDYTMKRKMEQMGEIDFTPNFDVSNSFDPTFDNNAVKKHFAKAIEEEDKSIQAYIHIASKVEDQAAKEVLIKLAELEQLHKQILEEEYKKLFSSSLQ
jgi:rubrerythrin